MRILDRGQIISCACGCGKQFTERDAKNRPRIFAQGHSGATPMVTRICKCGCGESFEVKAYRDYRYIKTHQNKVVGFQKSYTPWNKGFSYMPAHVDKLIAGGMKTRFTTGSTAKEKNSNWKDGITSQNRTEREKFRRLVLDQVLIRDNFTCQICSQYGVNMHVDHIKPFANNPELRFEMDNCRTLCVPCHYYVTFKKKMSPSNKWGQTNRIKENS